MYFSFSMYDKTYYLEKNILKITFIAAHPHLIFKKVEINSI